MLAALVSGACDESRLTTSTSERQLVDLGTQSPYLSHVLAFTFRGLLESGACLTKEAVVEAVLDRKASIVRDPPIEMAFALGFDDAVRHVPLQRAPAGTPTTEGCPPWLAAELAGDDGGAALVLRAGGTMETTVQDGFVIVPLPGEARERVPLRLRAYALERCRPGRLLMQMRRGEIRTVHLTVEGNRLDLDAAGFTARPESPAPAGDPAATPPAFRFAAADLRPAGARVEMEVLAGSQAGTFTGSVLLKPRPRCSYRLRIPYFLTVGPAGS